MTRWITGLWARLAGAELARRSLLVGALAGFFALVVRRPPPVAREPLLPAGVRPADLTAPLAESVLPPGPLGPGDDLAG